MSFEPAEYRINPRLPYNGLTIILSSPSRFDTIQSLQENKPKILTSVAGKWFATECLAKADINFYACEVRIADDRSPLRDGTRVIFCLGQKAQTTFMGTISTLGEQRGSPIPLTHVVALSSYTPQDCFDGKNHEKKFQEENTPDAVSDDDSEAYDKDAEDTFEDEKSHHGKTSRQNFKSWLEFDSRKVSFLLKHKMPLDQTEIIMLDNPCEMLRNHRGNFYFDIETATDLSIRCFAWCGEEGPVYVTSVVDYNDVMRPDGFRILLELTLAIRRAECVIMHNGDTFDCPAVIWRYGFPAAPKKLYDTMIAQHRCYPLLERSLGHCGALWTFEPYHKNDGVYNPVNADQEYRLKHYCGKDVSLMRLIKQKQLAYAETRKGLKASIEHACAAARAYMDMTLNGCEVDDQRRIAMQKRCDDRANLYARVAELLIGPEVKALVAGKGSKARLVSSPQQLAAYFHKVQKYPAVKYTDAGSPKLGENEFYKLALKIGPHPILLLTLAYREQAKAASDLKLKPYYRNYRTWSIEQCKLRDTQT